MEDKTFNTEDAELLKKLKVLIKKEIPEFEDLNEQEVGLLRDMIGIYESFKVFGRFAKTVRNIVIFVGSLLVGWFVLIDNLSIFWQKLVSLLGV